MAEHFDEAIEALDELAQSDVDAIVEFLQPAREHAMHFMTSLVVPWFHDGQRMGTANALGAHFFGKPKSAPKRKRAAAALLNSNPSNMTLARVVRGFGALMALAWHNICTQRAENNAVAELEGWTEVEQQRQACLTERFEHLIGVLQGLRDTLKEHDGPGGYTVAFEYVSSWFDQAMAHSVADFQILTDALTCRGLVRSRTSDAVKNSWAAWTAARGFSSDSAVCVWEAVDFLAHARTSVHEDAMPVYTSLLVVLSSVLGSVMHADVTGPFALGERALAASLSLPRATSTNGMGGAFRTARQGPASREQPRR